MKIIHVCLACFYIEDMEYQENVLPRKHKELGNDVSIITSQYAFNANGERYERESREYVNKDGISVSIIPYSKKFGRYSRYLRLYEGLYNKVSEINPDIIFLHGTQFFSIREFVRYKKEHPQVKVFADHHADYVNTPIKSLKQRLWNKYLWRHCPRKIESYCEKIWGVTPLRVRYLQEVYNLNPAKLGLLVMGGDEKKIDFHNKGQIRLRLRESYDIDEDDFVIVTGGKIDQRKNTHLLMEAVSNLALRKIKLVVFGEPNEEMKNVIRTFSGSRNIRMLGWISSNECYNWFLASDLAVFPGTHSVLWEQALACGIPCIFKNWEGMQHVDVGGNCRFLYEDSVRELQQVILQVVENQPLFRDMKSVAEEQAKVFSYLEIAKRSIMLEES